jgi:uncharacterized alkaline shock family protein YloU
MNSSYFILENYNQNGTIGISLSSFETIATIAANSLDNVTVKKNKKDFFLNKPVAATFKKGGKVELSLEVTMKKGSKVDETCRKIQEEVASAVQMMCETVPVRVLVKVAAMQ